jgi:metal-dependent hydrolase (beta-lactamase superfamily II)
MKSIRWLGTRSVALIGLLIGSSLISATPSTDSITVVCDHDEPTSKADRLSSDRLSAFVRFQGETILFNTGGDACPLKKNLEALALDATSIDAVVLSRNSSDQVSVLTRLLEAVANQPKVYVPAPAPEAMLQKLPQADIVAVSSPRNILPDAWLVGPLHRKSESRKTAQQVLVLYQPDGLVVHVGCSQPEVASVVERVREAFGYRKIKLLAGGIHLRETSKNDIREISLRLQQMGVKGLALSRCTGHRALKIFRDEWGDRLVAFDFGDTVDF